MITDGVDTPGAKVNREEAMRKLIAARATVHIISYTEFVRQKGDQANLRSGRWPTSTEIRSDHGDRSDTSARHHAIAFI